MNLTETNIALFRMINDLGKQYSFLNPTFIFIAEYMVYFLVMSIIFYWFIRKGKNRIMVICGVITFVVAEIFGKIAGKFHSNNQPFAELADVNKLIEKAVDNSFPSDHTILFFSFCVIFWLFKKGYGVWWFILAAFVGVSRIWVGVHYPADVTVGAFISIFSALIVYNIVPKLSIIHKLFGTNEKGESSNTVGSEHSKDM